MPVHVFDFHGLAPADVVWRRVEDSGQLLAMRGTRRVASPDNRLDNFLIQPGRLNERRQTDAAILHPLGKSFELWHKVAFLILRNMITFISPSLRTHHAAPS